MINVIRKPNQITSLNTLDIQNYIDQSIEYLNDPNNHKKPDKPTSYRNSDLLEAFDACFFSKCYLTEQKFSNSWAMDVEHYIPKRSRPDLTYDWNNLYPAEHLANMMKPRTNPSGGYLDPCNPTDDVENDIFYSLSIMGSDPKFEARNPSSIKSVNTADLLNRLHNGHDNNSILSTKSLRFAIRKKYSIILLKIIEWQNQTAGTQEEFQIRRELKDLLSKKSSYTMLCRSIPAVKGLPNSFFD